MVLAIIIFPDLLYIGCGANFLLFSISNILTRVHHDNSTYDEKIRKGVIAREVGRPLGTDQANWFKLLMNAVGDKDAIYFCSFSSHGTYKPYSRLFFHRASQSDLPRITKACQSHFTLPRRALCPLFSISTGGKSSLFVVKWNS